MGVSFDPIAKYILITSPTILISALEIYNMAMDWCDDPTTISYTIPIMAVGKFDMGGGVYSDSIFMLINGWKIKPWAGDYQLVISGTLLGEPGESRWVPPDSGDVSVEFQVSSQGIVSVQGSGVTQQDKDDIIDPLEAMLNQIKGSGWTVETLKLLKELVDELEAGVKPTPRASFQL